MERNLYVKLEDCISNSIDPDETAHYEPSHLDLHCLQKPMLLPIAVKVLTVFAEDLSNSVIKRLWCTLVSFVLCCE